MATHKIGKLKFNLSRQGLACRWGDGAIRRFAFGKSGESDEQRPDYVEDAENPYDEDGYFDDRAADDSDYRADDYDDGGGYDENGEGGYDEGEAGEYYRDEEPRASAGPVMEYIENNQWALIALLIALPPLGIYLIWRLNRFEQRMRMIISAVSAVWFILLVILLFSAIFGGSKDTSTPPAMVLSTIAPTVEPSAAPTVEVTSGLGAETSISPDLSASPTPLAGSQSGDASGDASGDTSGDTSSTELVYSPQVGLYYHSDPNCTNIPAGTSLSHVTVAAAKNRNQTACPLCIAAGQTIYYATKDGKWYHTDKNCQNMTGAVEYTKAAAEAEGKTPCPICAGGTATKAPSGDSGQSASDKFLDSIKNDKSSIEVYMTSDGKYYHTDSTCSGMTGAKKVTLLKALQSGKPACPICAAGFNKKVYCTENGEFYHTVSTCTNMKNAKSVTLAAALVLGKKKCPVCVSGDIFTSGDTTKEEDTVYVYATKDGKYYHTNATCSNMTGAEKVTLKSMIAEGRAPCPICAASADKTVYVSQDGKYYHSYATCSGMTNAKAGTLAQALSLGYTACPKCWGSSTSGDSTNTGDSGFGTGGTGTGETGTDTGSTDDANSGYSGVYVYATEDGKYYHTSSSCSKAEDGVTKVLLEQAIDDGKQPCPACAAAANETVYATKGGKYYHKIATCSGMTNAKSGTLAKALVAGLKQCPVCFASGGGSTTADTGTAKYTSGTSGIKVYATASGKYYHTKSNCSGISGTASQITLETALNYGKSACPVCAASADRAVYATKGGKYYHYSTSCAGSSAAKGTLDAALAYGLKPCPNCVTGATDEEKTPSDKYTSGTSGIKVYATTSGKYFHTKSNCGGMTDAKYITLETALNYGLTACPDCAKAAGRKVYSVPGSNTYHYDAAHAGSGAVSGTLAEALAYGLTPCKVCVTGENANGGSTGGDTGGNGTSAPADTYVYIDLSGDSSAFLYHTSSKCSESGMTSGTKVTLEYALNHGYSDCGYCNPPTSISQ